MSIDIIEGELPNGLHDAVLTGLHVDYAARSAVFELDVQVELPESPEELRYRSLDLTLTDLIFLVIDAPGGGRDTGALRLSSGTGQPQTAPIRVPDVPPGYFLHWFFVDPWNSFIRFAARSAGYRWRSDRVPRQ